MPYQPPAFYFYHAARAAGLLDAANVTTVPTDAGIVKFPLYDSRVGELYKPTVLMGSGPHDVNVDITGDTISDDIDTAIFMGANFPGNAIGVVSFPTTLDVDSRELLALTTVPGPFDDPVVVPMTLSPDTDDFIRFRINPGSGPTGFLIEIGEVWFSIKREMDRGPVPEWTHPWVRSQQRFITPGGVTSTWKTGGDRKRYSMTWRNVSGSDRQILLDMREQTDNWSQPFLFQPPDDTYPTVLVELDQDADWQNDIDNPLDAGTTDQITLPMIEVRG